MITQHYIQIFISKAYNKLDKYYYYTNEPNYEASLYGVVRNRRLKKPVGLVNNMGYLMFSAEGETYFIHIIIFEAFKGLIKDGFVIDHVHGFPQKYKFNNLRSISQGENTRIGKTGNYPKRLKSVKSFGLENNEGKVFQSMNAAGKDFDICRISVRFVAEGIYQTALSKKTGHRI